MVPFCSFGDAALGGHTQLNTKSTLDTLWSMHQQCKVFVSAMFAWPGDRRDDPFADCKMKSPKLIKRLVAENSFDGLKTSPSCLMCSVSLTLVPINTFSPSSINILPDSLRLNCVCVQPKLQSHSGELELSRPQHRLTESSQAGLIQPRVSLVGPVHCLPCASVSAAVSATTHSDKRQRIPNPDRS